MDRMADPHDLDRQLRMTARFNASQEGIELAVQRVLAGLALFYFGAIAVWTLDRELDTAESLMLAANLALLAAAAIRGWRTSLTIVDTAAAIGALTGTLLI